MKKIFSFCIILFFVISKISLIAQVQPLQFDISIRDAVNSSQRIFVKDGRYRVYFGPNPITNYERFEGSEFVITIPKRYYDSIKQTRSVTLQLFTGAKLIFDNRISLVFSDDSNPMTIPLAKYNETIYGWVKNHNTEERIPNVKILVYSHSDKSTFEVITDKNGGFMIVTPKRDLLNFTIDFIEFEHFESGLFEPPSPYIIPLKPLQKKLKQKKKNGSMDIEKKGFLKRRKTDKEFKKKTNWIIIGIGTTVVGVIIAYLLDPVDLPIPLFGGKPK